MILNYSDGKEHQICGFISAVDENNKEIKIALGFYQEMTKKELDKIDYLDAKLIKTTKKDEFGNSRQDNLALISKGEEVTLEFDYDSETYIVTDGLNEIGEISKAISKKLQKYEDNFKKFRSVLINLDYNESSSLEGKVRVFIN